jgi:hypothetical protein
MAQCAQTLELYYHRLPKRAFRFTSPSLVRDCFPFPTSGGHLEEETQSNQSSPTYLLDVSPERLFPVFFSSCRQEPC